MPRGTTLRNIRIDAPLWEAAQSKADAEGTTVSDVVRDKLREWIESPARVRVVKS